MSDYAHLYHILFNAITEALEHMEDTVAAGILRQAQQTTEELYMSWEDGEEEKKPE